MQKPKDWERHFSKNKKTEIKTDRICKQIFIGHRKEVCNKRTGVISSSVGTGTFYGTYLWKADKNTS